MNKDAPETIKVVDDGVSAKEQQRVSIEKVETVTTVVYDGSLNDIDVEVAQIDGKIAELQARRTKLMTLRGSIDAELSKLPNR